MFKLIVSGNVGKDAEIKEINGQLCLSFHIAHNSRSKDSAGNMVEKTTWISCSQWREKGSRFPIAQYLTKGSRIVVEGTPSVNLFRDQQNNQRAGFQLRISDIHLMGGSPGNSNTSFSGPAQAQDNTPAATLESANAEHGDDLPF